MTNIKDTDLWYIDIEGNPTNIIFNNGSEQTVDLETSGKLFRCENKSNKWSGTWNSFDSNVYFQNKKGTSENSSDIRLIGTIGSSEDNELFDLTKYDEVGFLITITVDGKEMIKMKDTSTVYTSVNALGKLIEANDVKFKADYLYVTAFTNVPESTKLSVTPYAKTASGAYYFGTSQTFIVYNA